MSKPIIAVTMGDAAGVGPEIILKAFQQTRLHEEAVLFVIGDTSILNRAKDFVNTDVEIVSIIEPEEAEQVKAGAVPA
ncbi:hypothetical protein BsIDN1_58240 [Bacillus safensis]|uniref:4-hydroxythreonine-4-phosphate dehydrogenase n=1 Tax=Bacillus safensis TaxID=561879 RepID=A0A5S9MKQ3_BACIA|nr:hypothetical protein BsIDN1_58240 [Bacillus safensis]